MKRHVWLPLWLLLALMPVLSVADTDISVESEGYGISRADALLSAKREALQKGIGTLLISETEIENFSLKKDMVLSRTIGAVRSYEILAERQDGQTYFVTIRAVVSEADIRQDLAAMKILLISMDKPRLMVLVKEESGRGAENAIIDYLTGKGFTVVDAATVAALMAKDDGLLKAAIGGDALAAARLGADNGADYVLVGKVKKGIMNSKLLAGAGMVSGQASMTARVINAASGAVISAKSATTGAAHVSAETAQEVAAQKVARKLMDEELFEQIVASFQDMVNNGKPIDVTFRNVDDFQTQADIKKVVTGFADVSVQNRSFADGQLILSVLYKGTVEGFCQMLSGRTVHGKKLAVTEIAGSRVVVVLQ
jgi:hypothetical protein